MKVVKKRNWHKSSLGDKDDAQTSNTHSAQKVRNTTLDNKK